MNDEQIRIDVREHCKSLGLTLFATESIAALAVTFRILGRDPVDAIARAQELAKVVADERKRVESELDRVLIQERAA